MFALPRRLDDDTSPVSHANHGLGPRQALWVTDGDVHVRRAEDADPPLWVLLSSFGHGEGMCRGGVRDGPRVEVWNILGPDGVSLPCVDAPPGQGPSIVWANLAPAVCLGR